MAQALSPSIQAFNQRLLAEHSLTEEEAQAIWESYDDGDLHKSIKKSNQQLKLCGLEIAAVSLKEDGKAVRHYALINKTPESAIGKWTDQERDFVRKILQTLVEDGATSRVNLINLKNNFVGLKLDTATAIVQQLVEEKWLRPEGGSKTVLNLAPRTYLELAHLLTDELGMDESDLPQILTF